MSHTLTVVRSALVSLPLLLASCAPSSVPVGEPVTLSADQTQSICAANPRVGNGGTLEWGAEEDATGLSAPYSLTCPDVSFTHDGQTVTVQAASLPQALARFKEDAFLLSYYADQRIRLSEDGTLTADPLSEVAEALQDEVRGVTVTMTAQGGTPQPLFVGGQVTPRKMDGRTPVRLQFTSSGTPIAWTTVVLNPDGVVQATMGR